MNYGTPIVNRGGIAILDATAINVGTDAVTYTVIAPNTRCVPVRGLILVNIDIEIPAGTTDTRFLDSLRRLQITVEIH